jgi:hypothetical protein
MDPLPPRPSPRLRFRRWAGLAGVVTTMAVLAAGCSSTPPTAVGTTTPGQQATSPSTTQPSTSTTVLQVTGALAPARADLTLGDLPAGWSVSHATGTVSTPAGLRSGGLLSCLGRPSSAGPVAGTSSPLYAGGRVTARSDLSFITPPTELSQELQDLHKPAGLACLGQAVTGSLSAAGPLTDPRITSLGVTPGVLDAALGVRYTARSPGGPLTQDVYLLSTGGNLLVVTFLAVGAPPSLATEHTVLAKVVGRL